MQMIELHDATATSTQRHQVIKQTWVLTLPQHAECRILPQHAESPSRLTRVFTGILLVLTPPLCKKSGMLPGFLFR